MENVKCNINLSVRSLVEFVLRSGDIDNRTTGAASKEAMLLGSRMHRKIQAMMGAEYKAEVPLKIKIEYDKYSISLEGRADGIITEEDGITIDEIKTMYADVRRLKQPNSTHMAQAMCYAYTYCVQNNLDKIAVQMTYCNLDTEEIRRFRELFSREEIVEWFNELIEKYIKWAEFTANERKLKLESISGLEFPFEYRKGQRNIVVSVFKNLKERKNLFIQAPTGVGKTMSTIFPTVRYIGEGVAEKIFYLTAKTITRSVAEEAYEVLRKNGLHFNTVTLTAKDKICVLDEPKCNPDACERAKGHFDRVNEAIFDIISNESSITREVIERYAEKYNVCPFEMSLDISNFMDGIICDYNYVFDPQARLKRYFSDGMGGNYIFLVDEAHNMIDRGREMYSAELVKEDFLACKKIVKDKSKRVSNALDKCNKELLELKRECVGNGTGFSYTLINETDELNLRLLRLQSAMDKFLEDNKEFDGRDKVLDLYFKVRNYLDTYEFVDENYEIYTDFKDSEDFFVKLFCVNPSARIKECMNMSIGTVFFSATLLPVNYYKELLCGNIEEDAIYIDSPFDERKRLLVVGKNVSTKYSKRNISEYEKILEMINEIVSVCKGNYMVFFPSYKLLNDVYEILEEKKMGQNGNFDVLCQRSSMSEAEREEFLNTFIEERERTLIGFCVLGGIFSEGIDLKNERLIGSIIVGTGLPMVCSEKDILKNYYDRNGRNGFDYAYKYPGMNKVLQAAGRVIRTDEDYGVIALLDERFLQRTYLSLFPREWAGYKVAGNKEIKDIVEKFWRYV